MTIDGLSSTIRAASQIKVVGSGSRSAWTPEWSGACVAAPNGLVAHDVDDQVVEVWAGTPLEELQRCLAKRGQCLPMASGLHPVVSQVHGTIGGLLAMNLPHALAAQCGGPRDWVLGMTIVRADGTVAKCGSRAVKSVAGYDVHRLFVGSRGTLGAIASAILRTFPVASLPRHEVVVVDTGGPTTVGRTLRTEFDAAVERTEGLVAYDRASCTIWAKGTIPVGGEGWSIGRNGAARGGSRSERLESRALEVFDPSSKLAPGWE